MSNMCSAGTSRTCATSAGCVARSHEEDTRTSGNFLGDHLLRHSKSQERAAVHLFILQQRDIKDQRSLRMPHEVLHYPVLLYGLAKGQRPRTPVSKPLVIVQPEVLRACRLLCHVRHMSPWGCVRLVPCTSRSGVVHGLRTGPSGSPFVHGARMSANGAPAASARLQRRVHPPWSAR